jgi:hypothetical protein
MRIVKAIWAGTLAATVAIASAASARIVQPPTYQQLVDKSDLVVIAKPRLTNDTAERVANWQGFTMQSVIGVETKFTVASVLKGDKNLKNFTLHHYRPDGVWVPNGPTFISFDPSAELRSDVPAVTATYILFLTKEPDSRYASSAGQVDPGLAIRKVGASEVFPSNVLDILRECKTIKPGMHRSDVLKVFATEGGLSTAQHRTYFYRGCPYPYIKVDVDFRLSEPTQREERPTDVVTKISKPYLDWSITD